MGKARTDLTKDILLSQEIYVLVNGENTKDWEIGRIPEDGADIQVLHHSKHGWCILSDNSIDTTVHPKGIIGKCQYQMITFGHGGKMYSHAWSRLMFAWFHGTAHKGLDICHIDGESLNNNISNLKEDTHTNNIKERKGAVNQYGLRKKDRE